VIESVRRQLKGKVMRNLGEMSLGGEVNLLKKNQVIFFEDDIYLLQRENV
jgi:hypothetical protein